MLPDRVSNPGPLTYESGALPIALRGPAQFYRCEPICCIRVIRGYYIITVKLFLFLTYIYIINGVGK